MAPFDPQRNTIEDVRSRSDIVDVIGRYVPLQRAGANFRARCPFHREKTPSFNVSPARQGFYCFGCGKGGDVFNFLMAYENVDFPTALRMLAEWAGVSLPEKTPPDGERTGPRKDVLFRLHEELARWYHETLLRRPEAQAARNYLAGRDYHADTAAEFMIGYADDAWDSSIQWGAKRGFPADLMLAAGVVVCHEKTKRVYDRFRDRIMFPIRDDQQRVIGFSGRALRESDKTAKYVNSPETILFQKKRVLFGFDRARRTIVEAREALICEGQLDVIRCHVAGFKNTVAAQGTAFSEEHAMKLARFADGVLLVFDADAAGRDAAFKTAITCLQSGLATRIAALPAGEDPDSMIRHQGADAFRNLLTQAVDALDFRLNDLLTRENASTEIGMRAVTRGIAELIHAARDPLQRERMVQHAAQRLVIDPAVLQRVFRSPDSRRAPAMQTAGDGTARAEKARRPAEEWALLEHLMAAPELTELVRGHLPPRQLRDPDCRRALEILLDAAAGGASDILGYCAQHDPEAGEARNLLAAAMMAPSKMLGREFCHEDAVKDLILKIWRENLRRRLQTLMREVGRDDDARFRMECAQLRTDIKCLDRWESGVTIIEMLVNA